MVVAGACGGPPREYLDLATTTSVRNSGLLDALLPHFRWGTVRVHAAGSGRSLEMLAKGMVDLVITHAPEAEVTYLAKHPDWIYRKFAHNRFVIVGPASDPADVRAAADAVDAFRRIAAAPVSFVSRGDGSGTHEREQALWKAAQVRPAPGRALVSGAGMAIALRQTHERRAYTLSDEATFWQMAPQLDLVVLFAGDARLVNTYAVVHPAGNPSAELFAEWLTRGDGRERLEAYRIKGRVAYTAWPVGCPNHQPIEQPCDLPP